MRFSINITRIMNYEPKNAPRGKGWFCTWPKCPIGKEMCLAELQAKFDIEEYVICEEEHKDESKHLHAFIKLKKRKLWNKSLFDIAGYHGNYQPAKSWAAVRAYVKKDGNFISSFSVENAMKKQCKMKKEDLLREVDEVLDEGLITPLQVSSFYKNAQVYKMLQSKRLLPPEKMPEKKRHLWFYGPSNTGKTYKLREMMLQTGYDNWFQIPSNNDWVGYSGQKFLYMDEFKGQLFIQMLNSLCDGNYKVNTKGGSAWVPWEVQLIICSNYSIRDCFNKADDIVIESLYNRFNEKQLMIKYK